MKAVIFDLGRVLVHWNRAAFLKDLAEISRVDEERLDTLLEPVSHAWGVGEMDGPALHQYLIAQAGLTTDYNRFYRACCQSIARNDRGLSTAKGLKERGIKVGVISNTNPIHASWLRHNVPEFDRFDAVILSSDVGLLKPDPAIFRLSLQRLGTPAEAALFIDDIPDFVAAAQRLGIAGVVHRDWDATGRAIEAWLADVGQTGPRP